MPALNKLTHEQFAQALFSGQKPETAYKSVYGNSKGAAQSASRLAKNPKIVARIQELNSEVVGQVLTRVGLDRSYVLDNLREIAERCMQVRAVPLKPGVFQFNAAGATKALELIGKELGMFVERKEVGKPGEFANLTDDELEAARQMLTKLYNAQATGQTIDGEAFDVESDDAQVEALPEDS